MSDESFKQLVGRLATEPDFAAWVRAHPDGLAHPSFGFNLTEQEAASLVALAAEGGTEAAAVTATAPIAQLETRRSKSGIAAGGAAAAVAAAAGGGYVIYSSSKRGYSGSRYSLDVNGKNLGQVLSVEGGLAAADVVTEKLGGDKLVRKHVGGIRYEDISLQIGLDMGQTIYDWIAQTWKAQPVRKNGSVVAANFDGKAVSQLDFFNAVISEVGIPAMDAASKDAAKMTVKIAPEYTRGSSPKASTPGSGQGPLPQKRWTPANFKIEIDGLDTSRVSKIDAFTVKQSVVTHSVGEARDAQIQPGQLEVPHLRITLASSSASSWLSWHDDFVIKGNNAHNREKSGSLHFLGPDLKSELGRIDFKGLGIFKIADPPATAGSEAVSRIIADLYCTTMDLHVGTPAPEPSPSPSPSATPSATPSASPSPSPTHAASPSPSPTVTAQPAPTASPAVTPSVPVSPPTTPQP